jgi:hypothetical protein
MMILLDGLSSSEMKRTCGKVVALAAWLLHKQPLLKAMRSGRGFEAGLPSPFGTHLELAAASMELRWNSARTMFPEVAFLQLSLAVQFPSPDDACKR